MTRLLRCFGILAASVTLIAQETGTLHGLVVQAKKVVASAQVNAENLITNETTSTKTDPDGRFTIQGLSPGKYRVSITPPGLPEADREVEIKAGSQSTTFELSTHAANDGTGAGRVKKPDPVPPFPQVPSGAAGVGNGGSVGVTSTAFGLVITLLKDTGIPPRGNTTLSVEFTPFLLNSKKPLNGQLKVVPKPRPDPHLTFQLQSAPPPNAIGNQVWIWALKAADDFNGSSVLVDVTMALEDAKGKTLDERSATTPALSLGHTDERSWIATYKDILGPVAAAIITGAFGFVAGRKQKKKKSSEPSTSPQVHSLLSPTRGSGYADAQATPEPSGPASPPNPD
jgi:Carboxypeptidase regulatory-like domain